MILKILFHKTEITFFKHHCADSLLSETGWCVCLCVCVHYRQSQAHSGASVAALSRYCWGSTAYASGTGIAEAHSLISPRLMLPGETQPPHIAIRLPHNALISWHDGPWGKVRANAGLISGPSEPSGYRNVRVYNVASNTRLQVKLYNCDLSHNCGCMKELIANFYFLSSSILSNLLTLFIPSLSPS